MDDELYGKFSFSEYSRGRQQARVTTLHKSAANDTKCAEFPQLLRHTASQFGELDKNPDIPPTETLLHKPARYEEAVKQSDDGDGAGGERAAGALPAWAGPGAGLEPARGKGRIIFKTCLRWFHIEDC